MPKSTVDHPLLQDAEMLQRAINDRGIRSIAQEVGCSRKAVANALRRLGVTNPREPLRCFPLQLDDPAWLAEAIQRSTAQEIAAEIGGGVNAYYVRQALKRFGIPNPGLQAPLRPPRGTGTIGKDGYRYVKRHGVKLREHRLIMEEMLGRKLEAHENVHHKNGCRTDNRPENLEVWSTSQPSGQRIPDKLTWAHELVALYEAEPLTTLVGGWAPVML